MGSPSFAHLTL